MDAVCREDEVAVAQAFTLFAIGALDPANPNSQNALYERRLVGTPERTVVGELHAH